MCLCMYLGGVCGWEMEVEDVYVYRWVEDVPVYICGCEGGGR